MTAPLVSVVVPTRNGASTIGDLVDGVHAQRAPFAFEMVAVDSGSTDATVGMLTARGVRVLPVSPASFDHGATRNFGIAATHGELVVLTVQDARPASPDWLERLVQPLQGDGSLAGTYSRQVPRDDASPLTRHYLGRGLASAIEPRVQSLAGGEEELARLTPMERYRRCVFDNVSAALRRSVWERHPFPSTPIAEDVEWARTVLLAGHRLAYVPDSVVVHSHDRPARYELHRTYLVHQRLRTLFGLRTVPTAWDAAGGVAASAFSHLKVLLEAGDVRPRAVARGLALAAAFPLGQYLGARSADTGKDLLRPRGV